MAKSKKIDLNFTYIITAVIIGIAVVGYALVTSQTKLVTLREENRIEMLQNEQQNKEESERKEKLETCLSEAEDKYLSGWFLACEYSGSNIKKDEEGNITNCMLPGYMSDTKKEVRQQDKDRCAELYK